MFQNTFATIQVYRKGHKLCIMKWPVFQSLCPNSFLKNQQYRNSFRNSPPLQNPKVHYSVASVLSQMNLVQTQHRI
jgi:hypothetical protein